MVAWLRKLFCNKGLGRKFPTYGLGRPPKGRLSDETKLKCWAVGLANQPRSALE